MGQISAFTVEPISNADAAILKQQVFLAARRMSNDQLLDLADALHDIIRARQVIRRTRGAEARTFAAEA